MPGDQEKFAKYNQKVFTDALKAELESGHVNARVDGTLTRDRFNETQLDKLIEGITGGEFMKRFYKENHDNSAYQNFAEKVAKVIKAEASEKVVAETYGAERGQIERLTYEGQKVLGNKDAPSSDVAEEKKELFKAILVHQLKGGDLKAKTPGLLSSNTFSEEQVKKVAGDIVNDPDIEKLFKDPNVNKNTFKRLAEEVSKIKTETLKTSSAEDQIDKLIDKAIKVIKPHIAEEPKPKEASPVAEKNKREEQLRNPGNAKADTPNKPGLFDNVTKNLTTATGALAGLGLGILLLAVPFAGPFLFFAAIAAGAAYGKHKTNERENAQAEAEATPSADKGQKKNSESPSAESGMMQQMQQSMTGMQQAMSNMVDKITALTQGQQRDRGEIRGLQAFIADKFPTADANAAAAKPMTTTQTATHAPHSAPVLGAVGSSTILQRRSKAAPDSALQPHEPHSAPLQNPSSKVLKQATAAASNVVGATHHSDASSPTPSVVRFHQPTPPSSGRS